MMNEWLQTGLGEFTRWCGYLGTFAFAISGIRLAAAHRFDWFGAFVVGFVTAVGGGTLRDIMLDTPIFWMRTPTYLLITLLALLFTFFFRRRLVHLNNTVFIFDAIGLGLFTMVGVTRSLEAGQAWWIAPIMGTITGSFGGMLRDIMINEVPLIFRTDFYAVACLVGSGIYLVLAWLQIPLWVVETLSAISIVVMRILAVKYDWSIPSYFPREGEEELKRKDER